MVGHGSASAHVAGAVLCLQLRGPAGRSGRGHAHPELLIHPVPQSPAPRGVGVGGQWPDISCSLFWPRASYIGSCPEVSAPSLEWYSGA